MAFSSAWGVEREARNSLHIAGEPGAQWQSRGRAGMENGREASAPGSGTTWAQTQKVAVVVETE